MNRNHNSWKLLAMFFAMAMLFALGSVNVTSASVERPGEMSYVNHPPGQSVIAITLTQNLQITNQMKIDQPCISYQVERGVSVPYLGLQKQEIIIYKEAQFLNNEYTKVIRHDLQSLNVISNEGISNIEYASDLGIRYASSILPSYYIADMNRNNENQLRGVNTRLDIGETLRI